MKPKMLDNKWVLDLMIKSFSGHDLFMAKKRPSLTDQEKDDWMNLRALIESSILEREARYRENAERLKA